MFSMVKALFKTTIRCPYLVKVRKTFDKYRAKKIFFLKNRNLLFSESMT